MILIIAYGNSLRQDDGAGLVLAEIVEQECRARRLDVERIVAFQLTPELSLEVARKEVTAVVFVDTRTVAPDEPDLRVRLRSLTTETASPSLGHHLNAAALLVYAYLLYGKHPPAWEVTVPGRNFGHGEGLSPIARRALSTAHEPLGELLIRLGDAALAEPA